MSDILGDLVRSVVLDSSSKEENDLEDGVEEEFVHRKKDGTFSKIKRKDYSRGPKRKKPQHPENLNLWLILLDDVNTANPLYRNGKEFWAKFRLPFPVFLEVVQMCRDTGKAEFNYSDTCAIGEKSISLDIKILMVLRTLAGGLLFQDAADMSGYMSRTKGNSFFKSFNELFVLHYGHILIRMLDGEKLSR
jgi:hypothetical protein